MRIDIYHNKIIVWLHVLTLVILGLCTGSARCYSLGEAARLRTVLANNYSAEDRPAEKVRIRVYFNVISIEELNIGKEKFSINGVFLMDWFDGRLRWNPQDYDGIYFQMMNEKDVWTPTVLVENSVSDLSVLKDKAALVRIQDFGAVFWFPPAIQKTSCDINTYFFPFDTQTCKLSVSVYGYGTNEVDMFPADPPLGFTLFTENGEWEILSNNTQVSTRTASTLKFRQVAFVFTMKRRPAFYGIFYLLPILANSLLTICVFMLTPESGEKVGLALTLMLAYTVLVTLLSGHLPPSASVNSVLTIYMAAVMILCVTAVPLSIWIVNIYYRKDSQKIPNWLVQLTQTCLSKLVCIPNSNRRRNVTKVLPANPTSPPPGFYQNLPVRNRVRIDSPPRTPNEYHGDLHDKPSLTWQDVAIIFDEIIFRIYFLGVAFLTTFVFTRLIANI